MRFGTSRNLGSQISPPFVLSPLMQNKTAQKIWREIVKEMILRDSWYSHENHQIEEEYHLPSTFIFEFPVIFRGYTHFSQSFLAPSKKTTPSKNRSSLIQRVIEAHHGPFVNAKNFWYLWWGEVAKSLDSILASEYSHFRGYCFSLGHLTRSENTQTLLARDQPATCFWIQSWFRWPVPVPKPRDGEKNLLWKTGVEAMNL